MENSRQSPYVLKAQVSQRETSNYSPMPKHQRLQYIQQAQHKCCLQPQPLCTKTLLQRGSVSFFRETKKYKHTSEITFLFSSFSFKWYIIHLSGMLNCGDEFLHKSTVTYKLKCTICVLRKESNMNNGSEIKGVLDLYGLST